MKILSVFFRKKPKAVTLTEEIEKKNKVATALREMAERVPIVSQAQSDAIKNALSNLEKEVEKAPNNIELRRKLSMLKMHASTLNIKY
jgi:hypothetical protein